MLQLVHLPAITCILKRHRLNLGETSLDLYLRYKRIKMANVYTFGITHMESVIEKYISINFNSFFKETFKS
jgi:hypothetical protein